MTFAGFPKISRFNREWIITEKIDGTNAQVHIVECDGHAPTDAVAVIEGLAIYAGSRTRFITPDNDNFGFAAWVKAHASELAELGPGTHFGEWWGSGIQRRYGLTEKRFSLFNTHRWGPDCLRPRCCDVVPFLGSANSYLDLSAKVDGVLYELSHKGSVAAPGFMNPEGIVLFHSVGGELFKITLEKDAEPKGKNNGYQH